MRGGDDPQIHALPLQRANRAELLLLDETQQLDLHFERQVANLVEERGAAVGQLHQALLVFHGAAERPLDVAEQLALHERAHQRSAIDGHKLPARVGIVDGARHHFLPRSAFSQQHHRQAVARRLVDQTPDRADLPTNHPPDRG